MTHMLDVFARGADSFMNLFRAGGAQFMDFVTGIIPLLVALLVTMNAIIKFIEKKKLKS